MKDLWEIEGNDRKGGSEAAAEGDGVAMVAGPWERERERERERRRKEKERVSLRGSEWVRFWESAEKNFKWVGKMKFYAGKRKKKIAEI